MIEAAMFLALGFFSATLVSLMVLPAIARRADRLARRRAEAAFPLSLDQVAAERDHLRAELAMRERGLERKLEAASGARALALDESGRKDGEIAALHRDIGVRGQEIAGLSQDLSVMTADRDRVSGLLDDETARHMVTSAEKLDAIADGERLTGVLHERHEELGALNRRREGLEQDLAGSRAETAALETRAKGLNADIKALESDRRQLKSLLADEQAQAALGLQRIARLEEDIGVLAKAKAGLEARVLKLQARIAALETGKQALSAALATESEALNRLEGEKSALAHNFASLRSEKAAMALRAESLVSSLNVLGGERDGLKAALAAEAAKLHGLAAEKATLEQAFMARGQDMDAERRMTLQRMAERDTARSEAGEARRRAEDMQRTVKDAERRLERLQTELQRDQAAFGEKLSQSEERSRVSLATHRSSDQTLLDLREERSRLKDEVSRLKRETAVIRANVLGENAALRREIMAVAARMLEQRKTGAAMPEALALTATSSPSATLASAVTASPAALLPLPLRESRKAMRANIVSTPIIPVSGASPPASAHAAGQAPPPKQAASS